MEEKENWLPVKGYKGLYEVSDMGRVRSVNYKGTGKTQILHQTQNKSGYMYVHLYKDEIDKCCRVHRLVAEVFVQNLHPNSYHEVNHKDEDKTNNCASNLEWCDRLYNSQYSNNVAVEQLDMDGNLVKLWASSREAERNGFHSGAIIACCKRKRMTHKGFRWRYAKQR